MEQPTASPSALHMEHELLELLETLSDDGIADVACIVDVCSGGDGPLLLQQQQQQQQQPDDSERLDSHANAIDVPPRAKSPIDSGGAPHTQQSHATTVVRDTHASSLARKRRVRPRQTSASRRSDPNKARNERKHELLYLHKQAQELEAQLRALQQRVTRASGPARGSSRSVSDSQSTRCRPLSSPSRPPSPLPSVATAAAAARVWQELAERQRALLAAAEKENIRLKLVVAAQRKASERLESLLLKPSAVRELAKCVQHAADRPRHRRDGCAMRSAPRPVCIAPVPRAPSRSDAAVFDALLDGVAQAHASVDSVFAAHGLAHVPVDAPHTAARVRRDATGRVCMQISASHVLPFGRDAVRDAVWHHFVFGKEAVPCRYHTERAPKVFVPTTTSYLKTFALEVHAHGETARFEIKQVLRQFDEHERVVIVWQALIEPTAFSAAPLPPDAGVIETGYIVLQRLAWPPPRARADAPSASDRLTLVQTHQVLAPHRDASAFFCVKSLTDFVLRATAANCATSHDMIEDALLAQAMETQQQRSGHR